MTKPELSAPLPGESSAADPVPPRVMFAERFAELYRAAGNPPLRRVAAAAQIRMRASNGVGNPGTFAPAQRISDWKAGRNVPARFEYFLPVLLTLIDQTKRVGDLDDSSRTLVDVQAWRRLWLAATSSSAAAEVIDTPCPYLGLTSYRSDDSRLFFGRTRVTAEFVELVKETVCPDTASGPVLLVGASGAGKSSLLQAGLIPVMSQSGQWSVATMTPGVAPSHALAAALASSTAPTLLLVDQCEELFTLCPEESVRAQFLTALRSACADGVAVVGAIRADFYARCLDYPMLEDALKRRSYVLGPMRLDELAEAVSGPADVGGFTLEPGLEELVITELCGVGGRSDRQSYDPGALPLLSHVMQAAWQRREGRKLTVAGYRKAGGVVGSVAETAEQAWSELTDRQRSAARELLLSLVMAGRDFRDTRRLVTRAELLARAADIAASEEALEALARTRLVTLDAQSVYMTHEIVLDAWPRLRTWIDEDRVGYLVRQRLDSDSAEWAVTGRDSSLLYRGARLTTAGEQLGHAAIGPTAAQFLAASERSHLRARQRSSATKAVLAVLAIIVMVLALAAYTRGRAADAQRNDAIFAGMLAEADRLSETDPALSGQLLLAADQFRPGDPDVRMRLLGTQNLPLDVAIPGDTGPVKYLAYRPDGAVLASAGHDNTVRLWDLANPLRPKALGPALPADRKFMTSAVFRPDGRILATSGGEGKVRLWDVADPARARTVGEPLAASAGAAFTVAFSPDGRLLAVPYDNGTVALWDVGDPAAASLIGVPIRLPETVRSVAFSPDGQLLATASDDARVRLWDVTQPHAVAQVGPELGGFVSAARSVAFRPTGRLLAASSDDGTVLLWNVSNPAEPFASGTSLVTHNSQIWSVAFSPDGERLATASIDGTAKLWDIHDLLHPRMLGQALHGNGTALTVAFSRDGRSVAVGGHDGVVRLWSLPDAIVGGHVNRVVRPSFSSDGAVMVTGSADGTVQLWDSSQHGVLRRLGHLAHQPEINTVRISPDGRTVAVLGRKAGIVRLFDVADPMNLRQLTELAVGARYTYNLEFSPNSRFLVTSGDDHSIQLWDLADRARPTPLGEPMRVDQGFIVESKFSPDGRVLATSANGHGLLWDLADPARPRQLGLLAAPHPNAVRRLAFSPDGRIIVSGGDRSLMTWDIGDPAHPRMSRAVEGVDVTIDSLSVSFDGKLVSTGADDSSVRLWELSRDGALSAQRHTIAPPSTPTWDVAFHPAGGYLAGAGEVGVLRLWDLNPAHVVDRLCAITGDGMTPELWDGHLPQLPYRPPCKNR